MKSVKKIIAALSAATMVSACAGVVASADEAVNAVNVSYSTVAETFTAADGTVVPVSYTHLAPFRFIQKDCLEDDTSEAIHAYCQQIKEKKNTIQLKIENGETYCFNLMQIQYFYSVRHDLFLVYSNKKIAKRLFPRAYTMDAVSYTHLEREGYQYLKKQILRSGDTLVIKELDRLSRSKSDIKQELEYFKNHGVHICLLYTSYCKRSTASSSGKDT